MAHLTHFSPLTLKPGQRLSREEFLARWERMPDLKKAELIDGVVYMPSPISLAHGVFSWLFQKVLSAYEDGTPGCQGVAEATWMMLDSAPQPDLALRLLPKSPGAVERRTKYPTGAPELAVEIALSSRSHDLGPKLALYQRAGVQEYAAVLIEEERIEWQVLDRGKYGLMQADPAGIFRSQVFPGLWLDSGAFWREDAPGLLAALRQGLQSAEHAAFVEKRKRG